MALISLYLLIFQLWAYDLSLLMLSVIISTSPTHFEEFWSTK